MARQGWVTVAQAAKSLTAAGDIIDASNVSKYLLRNPDVPQERQGKFRYVDFAALRAHRDSSIFVTDKRDARDEGPRPAPFRAPERTPFADEDDAAFDQGGTPLQQANFELKQIEIRRKRREEAIEEGRLVPAEDLEVVLSGVIGAFVGELGRQEARLTAKLGREAGIEIRKAHRAARAAASARLVEAAREQLHGLAAEVVQPSPAPAIAAA